MFKINNKIIETEITEVTISGKLFNLFREYLRTTKLSKQKLKILKLVKNQEVISLFEIANKTKMSAPLVSYHINGNIRNEGLIDSYLIETEKMRGGTSRGKINRFWPRDP